MKKLLAICLTVIMVFSMCSVAVSAAEIDLTEPVTGGYVLSENTFVNQKFYDDSTGTAVALTAVPDGWKLVSSQWEPTYDDPSGLKWTDSNSGYQGVETTSAIDVGSGNYELTWEFTHGANQLRFHFGTFDGTGVGKRKASIAAGYTIEMNNSGHKTIKLFKNGTELKSGGATASNTDTSNVKTLKLVVKDGVTSVYYSSAQGSELTKAFEVADTTPPTSGVLCANGSYSKPVILRTVKLTSSAKKASFLLDKKFSSSTDTLVSLDADGFKLSNIASVDANGLVGNTSKKQSVKFASKFGDAYTVEIEGVMSYNPVHIKVNMSDDSASYYDVYVGKDDAILYINKVTADVTTPLAEKEAESNYLSTENVIKYVVALTPQTNDDMKIDVNIYVNGVLKETLTATDEVANAPLTEGYIQYYAEYAYSEIKSMKVYPGATAAPYTGTFYVNGTTTDAKGETIMTFPVAMLGQTPDVIAALYEDGKVTDVEFINIADLNNKGYAELFDTTASTANKVNVKVFIWDTLEGLIPVTEAFSLVK